MSGDEGLSLGGKQCPVARKCATARKIFKKIHTRRGASSGARAEAPPLPREEKFHKYTPRQLCKVMKCLINVYS